MVDEKHGLSIVISGEAGQGIKTLETVLSRCVKASGWHVFSYPEFMSRIRGGNNTTEIRIGPVPVNCFVDRIDIAVSLQENGLSRIAKRITPATLILGDKGCIDADFTKSPFMQAEVPFAALAVESGAKILLNIVVFGALAALLSVESGTARNIIETRLKKGGEERLKMNLAAFEKGYEAGLTIAKERSFHAEIAADPLVAGDHLLFGSDAIGIGAIAAGCNFFSAYPMSPSTSVLEFMAAHDGQCGVVVEQAEDEIAAINMAIGSWYAGGRAMVATSGGGFALMEEAVSLAGCIESPIVIHIGQRPGPATGLPTRTEQADLNLALYAGHGEFPRIIFAPADFHDGIALAGEAFNLADKYQVPVFILTDQFYLDSSCNVRNVNSALPVAKSYVVATDADYRRYAGMPSGVSPRGIPGLGAGLVCADSDEHDENGHITEDFDVRTAMVDKRNRKLKDIETDAIVPRFYGPEVYTHLLVGWGSTLPVMREALAGAGRGDVAMLHFSQVYPIAGSARRFLAAAANRVIVENNSMAQFGALLSATTGLPFHRRILKYNGMPFSVEELAGQIKNL